MKRIINLLRFLQDPRRSAQRADATPHTPWVFSVVAALRAAFLKVLREALLFPAALLIGLPLIGIWFMGKPLLQYTEFPPLTRYVEHAGFSWPVFIGLAVIITAVISPFLIRILYSNIKHPSCTLPTPRFPPNQSGQASSPFLPLSASPFPLWGWFGLFLGVIAWVLAWNRFPWFAPFQQFTFTPLWISYILVVNAITYRRTGHCMFTDRAGCFLSLFPLSAAFWWFFEYLNRFVQNWYYEGIGDFTGLEYFVFATLPFSTVLPAVLGTCELLESFPQLGAGLDNFMLRDSECPTCLTGRTRPTFIPLVVLAISCFGLFGIGIWPDYLFPLLWIAPLSIITALQALRGKDTIFAPIRSGNWRRLCLLALSALICGFFWEMWNFHSLAKWKYAVPFVYRFRLFEMPILGYAGYLPFGLECAVIGDMIMNSSTDKKRSLADVCKYVNAAIIIAMACYFLLAPGVIFVHDLMDRKISEPGIPQIAWRVHHSLTPKYEKWAKARIASGKAANLQLYDVPSTEWPMFGSVFYLWATETMQQEWEKDHALSPQAPRDYARATIDAATELVIDPVHHTWVKTHWGADYMHRENVFFRAMIIAALTSREKLIGDGKHLDILRDQVESLSSELDASPFGVLNDYPDECYPVDVFASIACIRRADDVLGTDHNAFVSRAIRAFQGEMLDKRGLPPWFMDAMTGEQYGPSRGVGNSYVLIYAPELWPDQAKEWYTLYEKYFWQKRITAAGFREFPNNLAGYDWTYDVDAGPVVAGFSPAANAFGVAAARVNGRFDHAYVLSSQVLAATWPLPDGTLLGARILSNAAHAPYLGEAALLYLLTRQPAQGFPIKTSGHIPSLVYMFLLFYFGMGAMFFFSGLSTIRRWRQRRMQITIPLEQLQFAAWFVLLIIGITAIGAGHGGIGAIAILIAQFLPRVRRTSL